MVQVVQKVIMAVKVTKVKEALVVQVATQAMQAL